MKHTAEPWNTISTSIGDVWVYAQGEPVLEPETMPSTLQKIGRNARGFFRVRGIKNRYRNDSGWWAEIEANAQRVVACVNACKDMHDPAATIADLRQINRLAEANNRELFEVKSEKAALLKAMKRMANEFDNNGLPMTSLPGYAKAAITKARP